MTSILLINPNTSQNTTAMMVEIARRNLPADVNVIGRTARRSVPMILEEAQLLAAGPEVVEMGAAVAPDCLGAIVAAFGDPGINELRAASSRPVAGLCESSYLEASAGQRRFGIATVTPGLVSMMNRKADELGLGSLFTGVQLTEGDPRTLAANPAELAEALGRAVARCLDEDKAESVIIGGGPLGCAAAALSQRFQAVIVEPIPAAIRLLMELAQRARRIGRDHLQESR